MPAGLGVGSPFGAGAGGFGGGFGGAMLPDFGPSMSHGMSFGGNPLSALGLALMLPLIESQSKTDPALCATTITALLGFLQECEPHSMNDKSGATHLKALQTMVTKWSEAVSIKLKSKDCQCANVTHWRLERAC